MTVWVLISVVFIKICILQFPHFDFYFDGEGASKLLVDYGKNVIILVNIEIRIIYHDYSLTLKKKTFPRPLN